VNNDRQPDIRANLDAVRERIAAAAARAGRSEEQVTLVGVTKNVALDRMRAAKDAGLLDLGENRIQEWIPKAAGLGSEVRWHFIGRLQTNKVRYLSRGMSVVHSLDRPALLEALRTRWQSWSGALSASRPGSQPLCLVQVNIAGEGAKAGLSPGELDGFLEEIEIRGGVRLGGLMTIAPYTDDPERVRWVFARLRQLRDQAKLRFPRLGLDQLSMGMSGDYQVAVEEGATMVRIGTAIFGPRH
jgi:hypothetical protein